MGRGVSESANRLSRIARFTPWEASHIGAASQDILEAARRSFGYIDPRDPRNLVFPIQLALSVGTLMVQSGLRGLVTYEVIGARRYPKFVANVFEMFTEIQIFVGLEYRELVERYEARLKEAPGADATRVELGRTLIKCGLYDAAASNLIAAAKHPSVRAVALHEAARARSRAGEI